MKRFRRDLVRERGRKKFKIARTAVLLGAFALPLVSNASEPLIEHLRGRLKSERMITKQFNAGLLTRIFIKRRNWKEVRKLLLNKDPYVVGATIRALKKKI